MIFASCENDMAEIQRVVSLDDVQIEKATDVTMLYSDSAIIKVRIKADIMLNHLDKDEPKREFPEGLTVDFFNEHKQVTSHLSAKYGVHLQNENMVILRDSVVIWNLSGDRLLGEELIWDEKKEEIRSEKFVRVRTLKEEIYGRNFVSNQDFTKWEIKDVEGYVEVDNLMDESPD